ncbi:hypothetical protein GCM10011505_31930 [Tistrella bauzanensis]|uniref:Caa(3)-type oxidase subunit IV n=1 Tax=Tistrella bauzanensis TaxID=657419 RepID=A0ABQ1IQ91_9PROT|nr:cytochrome C oxidase subunit IV family protein [Tistrella bauzanensis]GGB48470.1 hypothetical protein GCM10011505_31930 [Tistrella bauzanensis]
MTRDTSDGISSNGTGSLVLAWAAMVALLGLTIAASFVLSGPFSIAAAIGIALAKAGIIFWVFMHLRQESGLLRLAAVGALVWLMILLLLSGVDYATRAAGA